MTGARPDVVALLEARGLADRWNGERGVFAGGCVERGVGSSFRAMAHTHTRVDDPNRGWICVRSARRLLTPAGEPSRILRHELAHAIAPGASHGSPRFVAALEAVGIRTDSYSRAGRARARRA